MKKYYQEAKMQAIKELIQESIESKKNFLSQAYNISNAVDAIIDCLKSGNKILICGNGGSAADAQHIAGEFIGRFKKERKRLSRHYYTIR